MAYFYLTHKNPDLANFDERLEDFRHRAWNSLEEQRPLERLKLERPVEDLSRREFSPKCINQLYSQKTDIEMNSLYDNIPFENKDGGVWKQGFNISYNSSDWDNQKLEVIILPHSHQDTGWRQTIDEYFASQSRQGLDSTVDFLGKNPSSRFIYAEISFLDMWWQTLTPSVRTLFTKLVREGQWEIATGGWVMNDEALTHYGATVSQLIEGQHWMLDNLGVLPNVSWAIDVFGHSTTEAYILAKAGIKDILIHRVHYEVKKVLAEKKQLEFIWKQPWDTTGESAVFTHMLPFFSYDVPHTCGPDPSICCQFDFMRISLTCPWHIPPQLIKPDNVAERAKVLVDQYRKKAKLYNNNGVLLVTLGDDFRFLSAEEWNLQVSNYEQLIKHINNEKSHSMHIRFGTLSEYFQLVGSRKPKNEFPTLQGDFYTYADKDDEFWNGYYTSRPSYKAMSRVVEAEVRNADILFSMARHWAPATLKSDSLFAALYDKLTEARRHLALFQHHDGIVATSKAYVMRDFRRRLALALSHAQNISSFSTAFLLGNDIPEIYSNLENLVKGSTGIVPLFVSANPHWNATASMSELHTITLESLEDVKTLYLYNSLPRARDHVLKLRVNMSNILTAVKKQVKQPLAVQLSVLLDDSKTSFAVQLEPSFNFKSPDPCSTMFQLLAGPIPLSPMELLRVTIKAVTEPSPKPAVLVVKPTLFRYPKIADRFGSSGPRPKARTVLGDKIECGRSVEMFYVKGELRTLESKLTSDFLEVSFDRDTGFAQTLQNKKTGEKHKLETGFHYMNPCPKAGTAGAYIGCSFVSNEPLSKEPVEIRVLRGPLTDEVTSYYPRVMHTLRVNKLDTPGRIALEVENIVNLTDANAVELVMTIKTGINNKDGTFFTDSNCFQMIERKYRTKIRQWGNVYPMSCSAFIEDEIYRVTLLSSQPLGFMAGEKPGEMKVWLDRRTFTDDQRGLSESMTDNLPARSLFRILIERISKPTGVGVVIPSMTADAHFALDDMLFPSAQFLVNTDLSKLKPKLALMASTGLPCNYDLVTMKTFFSKSERFNGLNSVGANQLGMILRRKVNGCGSTGLCGDICVCQNTAISSFGTLKLITQGVEQ
ncbi:hypothetical protein ACTXT7_015254 [Hymenolepis weldensis]